MHLIVPVTSIVPLKKKEYGSGYIMIRTPCTPCSIYVRGNTNPKLLINPRPWGLHGTPTLLQLLKAFQSRFLEESCTDLTGLVAKPGAEPFSTIFHGSQLSISLQNLDFESPSSCSWSSGCQILDQCNSGRGSSFR